MLLSVERPNRGSPCLAMTRGHAAALYGLVQAVLPASVRTCANGQLRFPRNLGDPVVSSDNPGRRYRVTNSRSRRCTRPPGSEPNEWNRGTAKRRQRSAAGWAAGSHSVLIVPRKLANSTQLEPVEGGETPDHGTVTEKHDECLEIREACPRNRNG